MKQQDIEDRVRQIAWPAPSPHLRERVLSTTKVAASPITWSDRVWFSRAWRLSAVAATLVVVVLNQVAVSPRPTSVEAVLQTPAVVSVDALLDELVEVGGGE